MRVQPLFWGVLVGLLATSGGCSLEEQPWRARSAQAAPATALAAKLEARDESAGLRSLLHRMGTSVAPPALATNPTKREEQIRSLVREQMKKDAFYDNVLPRLYPTLEMRVWGILPFYLHETEVDGRTLFYGMTVAETVRTFPQPEPCDIADAVEVRPWWNMKEKVLVCADSYKPKVLKRNNSERFCEATHVDALFNGDPEGCGCGENLVNCLPDLSLRGKIQKAYQDEPRKTIQHIIREGKAYSEILTSNTTVRSDLAQLFYARSKALAGGVLSMPALGPSSETPSLRPRDPAFDGGVLTTPLYRFSDEAPRVLIDRVFGDFLCMDLPSTQVKTSEIFSLDDSELRAQSHMGLAKKAGCKECHVRLEYGLQFFQGWSSVRDGQRLAMPKERVQTSLLYGRNSKDLRAEGPATTAWFGQALSQQPEFARCHAQRVLDFVYGGHPVPAEVVSRLERRFAAKQSFSELFEEAVVARFTAADPSASHQISATQAFDERLDDSCGGCHDEGEEQVSLTKIRKTPDLALRAAMRVAAGEMPPATVLDGPLRESLILGLCSAGSVSELECRKWYLPSYSTAPSAHPTVLERAAKAHAAQLGQNSPEGGRAESLLGEAAGGLTIRNTPTLEAAMLLLADKVCAGIDQAEPCIRAVLNGDYRWIPKP